MFCNKCGCQNINGEKYCKNCGVLLENTIPNQINQNFQQVEGLYEANNKQMDKKFLISIIGIVALLIITISIGSYYLISMNSPVFTYQSIISDMVEGIYSLTESDDKFKTTIGMNLNLKLEEDLIDEDILDLINNTNLEVEVQYDRENEKAVLKLDSKYDKDTLLKGSVYLNNKDNELYLYSKDIIDKYIKIESDELEVFDELFKSLSKGQQKNAKKSKKILISELKSIITKDDCYKEDGYHVLKISSEELVNRLEKVVENLKNNKEFLSCYENEDTIKDALDNITFTYSDDMEVKYFIKKTMFNKIEEIKMEAEDIKAVLSIEDNNIKYNVLYNGENIIDGTIENTNSKNENKMKLTMNITDLGKLVLNINTSYTTKFDMDTISNSKVISIEDLSENDMNEIEENLKESVLYDLISGFINNDTDNDNDYEYNYDNDYNYNNDNDNTLTTDGNSVKFYGSNKTVKFNVPSGYKESYASDTYKSFSKGDIDVAIYSNYGDAEEYMNSLNSTISSYENYYENVSLSSQRYLYINNRDFYYKDLSYEYKGYSYTTKYYTRYLYTQVTNDYGIVIEVNSEGEKISTEDIKEFLNISY